MNRSLNIFYSGQFQSFAKPIEITKAPLNSKQWIFLICLWVGLNQLPSIDEIDHRDRKRIEEKKRVIKREKKKKDTEKDKDKE